MDADGDQINGAVVSIRKTQDKIALWLKSSDESTCVRIGERWKKMLSLEKSTLRYQTHKDAAASGRSFRNDVHFEV
jgi:translation initiation factor 4E